MRAAAVAHDARLAAALEQQEYGEWLRGLSSIVEPDNAVREARSVIMLGEELNDLRHRSSCPALGCKPNACSSTTVANDRRCCRRVENAGARIRTFFSPPLFFGKKGHELYRQTLDDPSDSRKSRLGICGGK